MKASLQRGSRFLFCERWMIRVGNEIGKYIALILQHKPETIGLTLDEHGWASVEKLIDGIRKDYEFDMVKLEEIVANDKKQEEPLT